MKVTGIESLTQVKLYVEMLRNKLWKKKGRTVKEWGY